MLTTRPLSPGFGVEALGVDIARPLSDAAFAELRDAFFAAQVLLLRGQRLTPAQFLAFARRLGPPEPHVIDQFHHPEDADILILSNVVKDGKPHGPGGRRHVLPHRLLLPRGAGARDDAVLDRVAAGRRQHAVRRTSTPPTTTCPTR